MDLDGGDFTRPTARGAAIADRLAILAFLANTAAGVERRSSFVIPPATLLRAHLEARRRADQSHLRRAS